VPTTARHGVAWRRPGPSTGCCVSTMVDFLSEQGLSWVPSVPALSPLPGPQNGEPQLRLVLFPTRAVRAMGHKLPPSCSVLERTLPSTSTTALVALCWEALSSGVASHIPLCRAPLAGWNCLPDQGGETLQIPHIYAFYLLQGLL
jgi:hypothetical protein